MEDPGIRVLVQNGEYWLANNGDLAMLVVTLDRLRRRWPAARIGVMTDAPLLLRAMGGAAEPISAGARGEWPRRRPEVWNQVAAYLGPRVVGPLDTGRLTAGVAVRSWAQRADRVLRRSTGIGVPHPRHTVRRLPEAVRDASLVVAMGGGYFADVDLAQAGRTLDLLEYAVDHGIPAVMLGQGLGPIHDPDLLERAGKVLPSLDFIALREGLRGPALLEQLGVAPERVAVSGDDAVGLAYGLRRTHLGSGIGLCLRIAEYSPVADGVGRAVARAVHDVASTERARLVPLVISEYRSEDRRSTLPLVQGFPAVVAPPGRYDGPRKVIERVSECRVVVTGAYHLAVFALSQGIPVVALSSSEYYDDKFRGLRAMFGDRGLTLVDLHQPSLDSRLHGAIGEAWLSAPGVREPLRERALTQVRASEVAFERVFDLVEHAQASAPGRSLER